MIRRNSQNLCITEKMYLSGKRKHDYDGGRESIYPSDYLFTSSDHHSTYVGINNTHSSDHHSTYDVFRKHDFAPNFRVNPQPNTRSIPPFAKTEERDDIPFDGVSVGTWARVKRGEYMGDLAQVVHVNQLQRKATIKLLPRLDLQTVANKISGGITGKQNTSPDPRLITSSELDAYRVRVKKSLDRDTGDMYEVFEGMKLKDGYLFKKLALSSLIFCFSNSKPPSESELREFMPDKNKESNDVIRKQTMNNDNDNVGDGLLSSGMENGFQVPDFVTHGPVEASLLKKGVFYKKSDTSCLGGESFGCSEPEPPPEVSPAVGYEGLANFVEKLRSGAQELGGLMEEAATRCLGKVSLEDKLRGALLELELCKERVSAVEAERDTFCNSLKEERERVSAVEVERDTLYNSLREEREKVSAVEAERDTFCNSLKEERENIVSVFSRLLDTEVQLVTRLKEDLRVWCARYEANI